MRTILVVEDDEPHRRALTIALTARGFRVVEAGDGREARLAVEAEPPDLVLLDLGLPDVDGVDLCRHLHSWPGCPIIIVSADANDQRIVDALGVGADDYVVKPVTIEVLMARIGVQLRHAAVVAPLLDDHEVLVGDVRIDVPGHYVEVAGEPLELQPQQFTILSILMRNAGRLVTHDVLARALGSGVDQPDLNAVRVNVSRLRRRLGDGPERPEIVSERHVGYRLAPRSG
ncbi:MAG: response regulator transcription factor [Acidimicrobiia bacterium]